MGASAVASGSPEGENEEPVRAQHEATDPSTPSRQSPTPLVEKDGFEQ